MSFQSETEEVYELFRAGYMGRDTAIEALRLLREKETLRLAMDTSPRWLAIGAGSATATAMRDYAERATDEMYRRTGLPPAMVAPRRWSQRHDCGADLGVFSSRADSDRALSEHRKVCPALVVPPKPLYGQTKHRETGPSAVASAPARVRDDFSDLCSEWDLLPDVRR